jgi:hypothetical protein
MHAYTLRAQVRFSESIDISHTYSAAEYDRSNGQLPSLAPDFIMEAHDFLTYYKRHEVRKMLQTRQRTRAQCPLPLLSRHDEALQTRHNVFWLMI